MSTAARLHHCSECHENSEVWKRTKAGAFFSYCINRGCPKYRREKNSLDKSDDCATITKSLEIQPAQKANSMTYKEAKILIDAARECGYKGTEWEQAFLGRLELMAPAVLRPEDALSVQEFYRRATGGGYRMIRHRYKSCEAEL